MHSHFPNLWELDIACIQLNGGDYAANQNQLAALEKLACDNSSEGACWSFYSTMRIYAAAAYSEDLTQVFDSDGYIRKEKFYDILDEAARDPSLGFPVQWLVRWRSSQEIARSKICFNVGVEYWTLYALSFCS